MKRTIHNAQCIIHHWVSCSWRIVFMLLIIYFQFSILNSAFAQTTQDALYIFRNDGEFNFFFFGELDHIDYSRVDTFGIEQDDYVVQEFYTKDTVYRIPISAIDSVSFVTPETKFKDDVINCNDLAGYISESDGEWYIFMQNYQYFSEQQKEALPKVGDKMIIDVTNYTRIPNGFGGRVIVSQYIVSESGYGGWLIVTEPTPITDMYDQIVIKEAGQSDGYNYGARAWKGNDDMEVTGLDGITINVPEQTLKMPSLSSSFNITHSLFSTPFESPISISGDLTGYGIVSLNPALTYRGCLFVSPFTGVQFDQRAVWEYEKTYSVNLEGTLNGRFEIGFPIKREVNIGQLKIKFGAGLFMESSMTGFSLSIWDKTKTRTTTYMAINQSNPTTLASLSPTIRSHTDVLQTNTGFTRYQQLRQENAYILPTKMNMAMGLYAVAETSLKLPLDKSNPMPEFIKKYLSGYTDKEGKVGIGASLGFDIGVKCDVECPWPLLWNSPSNGPELLQSQNTYKDIRDHGSIQLSGYAKATAELSLGNWKLGSPHEISYPIEPRYFVPDITGISVTEEPDENPRKPYAIRFTSPISREMFIAPGIGFAVFNENNEIVDMQHDLGWGGEDMFNRGIKYFQKPNYYNTFKLDPGKGKPIKYTVHPLVITEYGGMMLVDQSKTFTLEAARFDINQRTINVSDRGGFIGNEYVGFYDVEVVPNMENVEVKAEAAWLGEPTWLGSKNELSFHWEDLPGGMKSRRGVIRLIGKSKKDELLAEDSIVVIQSGPYMVLEPDKLVFPKEGGTKTVTIKETNLTNLRLQIPASSPEIKGTLTGNVVLITMPANTGAKRGNQVRIVGKYIDGTEAFAAFEVEQEGNGTDPDPEPGDSEFEITEIIFKKLIFGQSVYPPSEEGKVFSFSDWETKTDDEGYADYGTWWNAGEDKTQIRAVKNNAGGYTISAKKTVVHGGTSSQGISYTTVREITFNVLELQWVWKESRQEYNISANGLTNLKASENVNQNGYSSTEVLEIASLPSTFNYTSGGIPTSSFGGEDVYIDNFSFKSIVDGHTQQEMTTYNGKLNVEGTEVPNHFMITVKFKKKQ